MAGTSNEFAELLQRIRTGDDEAVTLLVRQFEPEVRRLARALLGPALRPHLDSVDVAQSVNFILVNGIRSHKFEFANEEKLISLAVTLVRRRVGQHWRKVRRWEQVETASNEGGMGLIERLVSLRRPAENPAEAAEHRDRVAAVFRELSDIERQIIELRLEGHTTAEVSRRLKADPAVLRVRLSRLRKRLREIGILGDLL